MHPSHTQSRNFDTHPVYARVAIGLLLSTFFATTLFAQDDPPRRVGAAGKWLRRLQRLRPSENERSHPQVKEAFRTVVQEARRSTVRVLCDDLQVALGTIVDSRGYVVTKASELRGEIECLLTDGRRLRGRIVARQPDYDLALLKVPVEGLPAVRWSDSTPTVGAWIATSGINLDAKAVGVISTPPRNIPSPRAVLGVELVDTGKGPQIRKIFSGSAAAMARLKVGDIITRVNDQQTQSRESVSGLVSQHRPGDQVHLSVLRGERSLAITATLGDIARLANEQVEIMDSLGGPLSNRRNGFPLAIQHDTVLRPRDCGGPLVDLTGSVVGINIARASRVATFAIPAGTIQSLLPNMMSTGFAATQTAVTEAPVGED